MNDQIIYLLENRTVSVLCTESDKQREFSEAVLFAQCVIAILKRYNSNTHMIIHVAGTVVFVLFI